MGNLEMEYCSLSPDSKFSDNEANNLASIWRRAEEIVFIDWYETGCEEQTESLVKWKAKMPWILCQRVIKAQACV